MFESTLVENPPEYVTTDQMQEALNVFDFTRQALLGFGLQLFCTVHKAGIHQLRRNEFPDFSVNRTAINNSNILSIQMTLERAYQMSDFLSDGLKLRLMSYLGTLDGSEYYGDTGVLVEPYNYKIRIYERTFDEISVVASKAPMKSWQYRRMYEGKTVHSSTRFRTWFLAKTRSEYAKACADGEKPDEFDFYVENLEKYQDMFIVTYPIICDFHALRPGAKLLDQFETSHLEMLLS